MALPQIARRRPMTKYVGPKRTRVAVNEQRRRAGQKAVERMRSWHDKHTSRCPVPAHDPVTRHGVAWEGHCAHSVACAYGRSASGWNAVDGWFKTDPKFRHAGKKAKTAPRGALVFWSGGSAGYGHVAIANGRGRVWGVDLPDNGRIGLVPTDEVARRWGLKFLGWIFADQVAGW